jgi:hypothetical protein
MAADRIKLQRLAVQNTSAVIADGDQDGVIEVSHNYEAGDGQHTVEMSEFQFKTGVFIEMTSSDPNVTDSAICLAFSPREALAIANALRSVASEVTARTILGVEADEAGA